MRSLRTSAFRPALVPAVCLVFCVLLVAGCGGKDKALAPDTVLAKVGDMKITADYYEKKLGRLNPVDLPRDDDGNFLDTAELPGKRKFLDTVINKNVMVTVAKQLGFDADPQIDYARKTLISYEAVGVARERFVDKPASEVDEALIQSFYEKLGLYRKCRYFITNTREDALRGREKALAGADWEDLWREFHDGVQNSTVSYNIDIHYGRFITSFEDPIFACKVGDITEPVPSTYGWWVLKVDSEEQGKKPPLEEARKTITASIINRAQMRLIDGFKEGVRTKYKMYLNEDALVKAYEGLPPDESMFYPGTQDAVKREDLQPLQVDPADYEMDFYGYEVKGEPRKYTLGDFKAAYDRMSVFERPKWGDMLGGIRQKITDEIDRALLNFDAEDRGLHQDPEVLAKVDEKIEEMLVSKLFEEGVHSDKTISPAALDSAWALLKGDYNLPETRSGKRILCADAAQAALAYKALQAGDPWRKVLNTYGSDDADKAAGGSVGPVPATAEGPERDALFALQAGQYGAPVALADGRQAILMLEDVVPPRAQELAEVADMIVKRIQNKREEMAFRAALDGWKKQVKIEVFEDRLAKTRSWKELTDAAKPTVAKAGK